MRFISDLYLSEGMKGRERKIVQKLKLGAGLMGVYCIAVPLFGSDPLEIINAAFLKQRWFRKSDLLIVGFAGSLVEAELLSSEILSDIHDKQGNYDTRSYFNLVSEGGS